MTYEIIFKKKPNYIIFLYVYVETDSIELFWMTVFLYNVEIFLFIRRTKNEHKKKKTFK